MKIHVLVGLRKESYAGEYGAEILLARDEYCVDENPEGWHAEVERAKQEAAGEMQAIGVFDIEVDEAAMRTHLLSTPALRGASTAPPEPAAATGDERERFDRWFTFAFGACPAGDITDIEDQIDELRHRAQRITTWKAEHHAALSAWHEKHSRSS